MIEVLVAAMLAQGILVLGGLGLMQLISGRERLCPLTALPYGWCFGVLILYLFGSIAVRIPALTGRWHYVVAAACCVAAVAGWWRWRTGSEGVESRQVKSKWSWLDGMFLGLILLKVVFAAYVLMVNPVIDADAAHLDLWVGLSKVIAHEGTLPEGTSHLARLFCPSLLPAWTHRFLPRWHDGLISLPWLVTYLSFIGVGFTTCYSLTRSRAASLVAAYFLSAIPLGVAHVMRPGYSDFIVAYFFLVALSFVLRIFFKTGAAVPASLLACLAAFGGLLTKEEGNLLFVWVIAVIGSFYISDKKGIEWKKILIIQIVGLAVIYGVYFFGADLIRPHIESGRMQYLFTKSFNVRAIGVFFDEVFGRGTFNLLWWFAFGMMSFLVLRKTPAPSKALTIYLILLFAGVFYFCCFTVNIQFTLKRTNAPRFLLQIIGIWLPLYVMFCRDILLVDER